MSIVFRLGIYRFDAELYTFCGDENENLYFTFGDCFVGWL